jgi:hypothetical protein
VLARRVLHVHDGLASRLGEVGREVRGVEQVGLAEVLAPSLREDDVGAAALLGVQPEVVR